MKLNTKLQLVLAQQIMKKNSIFFTKECIIFRNIEWVNTNVGILENIHY